MEVELNIDRAIDSLEDAAKQIVSKNPLRLRVTRYAFKPAPKFQPKQIVFIRKSHKLTQESFASALNVPRATVASWETGRKKPSGAALRLLEVVKKHPELLSFASH